LENLPKRYEHCKFENYIGNEEIVNELKAWKGSESVVLLGKVGTGKTHLAVSLMKNSPLFNYERSIFNFGRWEVEKIQEKARCLFLPVVELVFKLNDVVMSGGNKSEWIERYLSYNCLCLDDFGSEKITEAARQNLYYIIDKRYRDMKPIIITSNLTMNEINEYEPRIASRLVEMGKIIQISGEDYRLKLGG